MKYFYLSTLLTFSFFFLNAQTASDNNPNFTLTTEGTCICATAANGETGTFFTGTSNEITYTKRTRAELDVLINANVTDPQIALTCTSGITNMSGLFAGINFNDNTFNQDISSWDVSGVTDMNKMFFSAIAFNQPLNDWDVSGVTDMSEMFSNAESFNGSISDWDVSGVTNMFRMFEDAFVFNQPLNDWDVSGVTNMELMLSEAMAFNQPLNNWDVSSVTNMFGMFYFAQSFNQDISRWCVENINSEPDLFSSDSPLQSSFKPVWGTCPNPNFTLAPNGVTCLCPDAAIGESAILVIDGVSKTFTKRTRAQLDAIIGNDQTDPQIALTCTSGITDMSGLFFNRTSFNQDISTWDVSGVTNMSQMFLFADSFNQPLNDWDVSQVTDMSLMFGFAVSFNLPLNDWDVSQVTGMAGMFQNNISFNQPLNDWDVSNVTTMAEMFFGATAFNQPLNDWGVSSVTNMSDMFGNASLFNQDLSNWCVANIASEPSNFSVSSPLQESFKPVWGTCLNPNFTLAPNGVTCLCTDAAIGESGTLLIDGVSKTFTKRDRTQLLELIANDENDPQIALTCTSGITAMSSLFLNRASFNQDISSWDVSNVTNMSFMFDNASSFDQSLNDWDVSGVNNMIAMFQNAGLFNQPLNDWDVSNVTDMGFMFFNAPTFNQPLDNWDVSSVTNMGAMFYEAIAFNQPLNDWDVSSVTDMGFMFFDATSFDQPLYNWEVSSVADMRSMFSGASAFNQSLNDWDVSSVTNMSFMFNNASSFDQSLNDWEVSGVNNMKAMFQTADLFNQPLNDWDVSGVTDMNRMFFNAPTFNQPLDNWDVSKVTIMIAMFGGANFQTSFNQPINDWDVSQVTNMFAMFQNNISFNQPLNDWDVSGVTDMDFMFFEASSFDQDISNWCVENILSEPDGFSTNSPLQSSFKPVWGTCPNPNFTLAPNGVTCLCPDAAIGETGDLVINGVIKTFTKRDKAGITTLLNADENNPEIALTCTSGITDMSSLFLNRASFNQDISSWDVSNVTNMSFMFSNASSFSQPLNDWDVSGVTDMNRMFNDAESFNQPLNDWNVSNVTNMRSMFFDAPAFNQPLDNWDVSNVTNMIGMFGGFDFQTTFNQPIDDWDVSQVTTMVAMFQNNISFNQPLNDWDVSNVINMRIMFYFSSAFNQPLNNWNVSNVTNMSFMFFDASSFDQALNNWNVSGVTTMRGMFGGFDFQTTFNQSINDWDVSQVTDMVAMFQNNISFNQPLNDWDVSSVTTMDFMFIIASSFDQDISNWCVENIISEPSNFSVSSPLQESFKPVWGTCPLSSELIFENIFNSGGVAEGAVAFADVDGDNDQDVFLSGVRLTNPGGAFNNEVARIYLNDGAGNYTFMNTIGLPIVGRSYSSASFIDLNNDGTTDLVHTGENYQTGNNFGEFFSNDGLGDFTSFTGLSFPNGLERIDFKFSNLDGDTDKDVVIIAQDISGNPTTLTYRNTSPLGFYTNFNPKPNNLPQVLSGSIDLADVDGDGDNDVFISGRLLNGSKIAELYLNQGNYQFSLDTQFTGVDNGDSRFADLDNDGDQDLLISGQDMNDNNILKLYLNDAGIFTEIFGVVSVDENILIQAFDFGDIDGDSDLDLFMTGYNTTGNNKPVAQIWENKLIDLLQKNSGNRSDLFGDYSKDEAIANFGYNFSLYPNPTKDGHFSITTPSLSGEVIVKLNNMLGQQVMNETLTVVSNKVNIYAEGLSAGVYVVKLTQENQTFSTKLIVE